MEVTLLYNAMQGVWLFHPLNYVSKKKATQHACHFAFLAWFLAKKGHPAQTIPSKTQTLRMFALWMFNLWFHNTLENELHEKLKTLNFKCPGFLGHQKRVICKTEEVDFLTPWTSPAPKRVATPETLGGTYTSTNVHIPTCPFVSWSLCLMSMWKKGEVTAPKRDISRKKAFRDTAQQSVWSHLWTTQFQHKTSEKWKTKTNYTPQM